MLIWLNCNLPWKTFLAVKPIRIRRSNHNKFKHLLNYGHGASPRTMEAVQILVKQRDLASLAGTLIAYSIGKRSSCVSWSS